MASDIRKIIPMVGGRRNQSEISKIMSYRRQTPARDGGRQRSASHVQSPAHIAKPAIAQAAPLQIGGGYDKQFEAELTDAIGTVITAASTLPGSDVLYIRSLETLRALSTAMAAYLAMIPDAVGSGIELRATIDDLADGLFKLATATASSPHTQRFRKRLTYLRDGEVTR